MVGFSLVSASGARAQGGGPEDCELVAQRVYEACLALGLDEEICGQLRDVAFESCQEVVSPPPDPASCQTICESSAWRDYSECLSAGGEPEECSAKSAGLLQHCLEGCEVNPPPLPCEEKCLRLRDEILASCFGPDGQLIDDPQECELQAEEAFRACLESCNVPPPPACEESCALRAEDFLRQCLEGNPDAAGEIVDPAECQIRADQILTDCLRRCQEPPPPPPDDCRTFCEIQFDEFLRQCHEGDPAVNPEECHARAEEMLRNCLQGCGEPPPPPPPTCEEGCERLRDEILQSCLGPDGQLLDDAQECEQQAEEAFHACLERCNVPPPPECEESCMRRAEEFLAQCLEGNANAAGEILDPAECHVFADEILSQCLRNCDQPPPPPDDCAQRCEDLRAAILESCIAADGQWIEDPQECEARAEEAFRACLDGCNMPPPICEESCAVRVEEFLRLCLEGNADEGQVLDPQECQIRADQILTDCLRSCEQPPPPPPEDCPLRCERLRDEILTSCLAEDGQWIDDPAECERRAEEAVQACLERCNVPPPPECEESCAARAEHFLEQCLQGEANEAGEILDPDECQVRAQAILDACLSDCGEPPPPPPGCETQCRQAGELILQECIAMGGDDQQCRARMEEHLRSCLLRCDEDEPPPPPEECPQLCDRRGQELLAACLERNGDPAECEANVASFIEDCVAQCDHGLPPSCEDHCAQEARASLSQCLASGQDSDACREQANRLLEACLMGCGREPPSDCDQGCGERARSILSSCLEAGEDPAACQQRTNDFLERCLAECQPEEPPELPSCPERCQDSANVLASECMDRGGDEANCQAEADAYLARCAQRCEAPPPPEAEPCDQFCDEVAERMRQECAARGDAEAECQKAVEEFLALCQVTAEEVCDRSQDALGVAPVMFIRGNFNGDAKVDISDGIGILGFLFLGREGTPCEDAADANDDGLINLSDGVAVLSHLFLGAGDLPAPATRPGHDPTSDELMCWP